MYHVTTMHLQAQIWIFMWALWAYHYNENIMGNLSEAEKSSHSLA
jgi:hypothetical protein